MNSLTVQAPARLLFSCGREPAYPRNALLLSLLQEMGETRTAVSSSRRMALRYAGVMRQFAAHLARQRPDLLFVGFLGQPLVPLMRCLYRGPLLFDAFISLYDTLCFDRKTVTPHSLVGRLAYAFDQRSCQLADCILLDTQTHADYFQHTFDLPAAKLKVLPVGCDERLFFPLDAVPDPHLVFFTASYLPLHAVPVILEAARLLKDTPIRFQIIGDGPQKAQLTAWAAQQHLDQVEFLPTVPIQQLPAYMARAQVILGGHFGASDKAARVIAGKTYPALAMGKAVLVGDNPANRELLTHGHDAWYCRMNDPAALAEAVQHLTANPALCAHLGHQARQTFEARASRAVIAAQLRAIVQDMLPGAALR